MLAGRQAAHAHLVVEVVRGDDQAGVGLVEQLGVVGDRAWRAERLGRLPGACQVDVGGADDLDAVAELVEALPVRALHVAAADDRQPVSHERAFPVLGLIQQNYCFIQ